MITFDRRAILATGGAALGTAALPARGPSMQSDAGALPHEPALQPELEIVDPHFHLRDQRGSWAPGERYRAPDYAAEIALGGHRVVDSVFIECSIMYHPESPLPVRSLGETEYVGALPRQIGRTRIASGHVARIDLTLGEQQVASLLERHEEAAKGRLRGIRNSIAHAPTGPFKALKFDPHLLREPRVRGSVDMLGKRGLVFESWLLHPQMDELAALAKACPDTILVLEHLGCPLGTGAYAGKLDEVYRDWHRSLRRLAQCPNVVAKIGGLGPFWERREGAVSSSQDLAASWKPWVEAAIDLFGASRCMFESNWPANRGVSSYGQIWNAFKRLTQSCSQDERAALFASTARSTYRLEA